MSVLAALPFGMSRPVLTFRPPLVNYQPRHFNLPSMGKVTETLGALNTLGRFLLKMTNQGEPESPPTPTQPPPSRPLRSDKRPPMETESDESSSSSEEYVSAASHHHPQKQKIIHTPPLTVDPAEDEELHGALYTLGRNVLGKVIVIPNAP